MLAFVLFVTLIYWITPNNCARTKYQSGQSLVSIAVTLLKSGPIHVVASNGLRYRNKPITVPLSFSGRSSCLKCLPINGWSEIFSRNKLRWQSTVMGKKASTSTINRCLLVLVKICQILQLQMRLEYVENTPWKCFLLCSTHTVPFNSITSNFFRSKCLVHYHSKKVIALDF